MKPNMNRPTRMPKTMTRPAIIAHFHGRYLNVKPRALLRRCMGLELHFDLTGIFHFCDWKLEEVKGPSGMEVADDFARSEESDGIVAV